MIELGARVRFPHPLVRSAVYRASDPSDRRDVRRALADSTDPVLDPDRRAWHRAHATTTPDEAVAAEMARSADRARGRGGLAAAAAFLQRAAELTPDPAVRVERSLAAAQAKLDVADAASASALLAAAELGPLDELQRGRLERLRAEIAFTSQRGRDAPLLLLEAARRLEPLDGALARETYLEAIASAMFAGRLGTGPDTREVAEAAASSDRAGTAGVADLLLDGLVTRFTEGYAPSVAPLSRALRAFADPDGNEDDARWLWLACRLAQDLWDDELWYVLATRAERVARDTGALGQLANALNHLAAFSVHSGAFATAAVLIDEVDVITQATGLPPLKYAACKLAASRGDQVQMQAYPDHLLENAVTRGEGSAVGLYWALAALLHNGYGQYGKALAAARQACEHEDVMVYGWALVELVEAGVRDGQPDEAAAALDRLSERTQASGTEWALGVEARARALLNDDEDCYVESIERLARRRAAVDLAAEPARVRRVAPAPESPHGRTRTPPLRPRELQPHGRRSVRRACPPRAPRHWRNRAPENRGHTRHPHAPGASGRDAGPRRVHQPGDRGPALHQPADRRVPPGQGVREARRQEPQGASGRTRRRLSLGARGHSLAGADRVPSHHLTQVARDLGISPGDVGRLDAPAPSRSAARRKASPSVSVALCVGQRDRRLGRWRLSRSDLAHRHGWLDAPSSGSIHRVLFGRLRSGRPQRRGERRSTASWSLAELSSREPLAHCGVPTVGLERPAPVRSPIRRASSRRSG